MCGTFNLRAAGVEESMKNSLRIIFSRTRESLHLNCLSYHRRVRDPELFYVRPSVLVELAEKELSTRYMLCHGLPEGDIFFTVY